jgi:hypothetical protein
VEESRVPAWDLEHGRLPDPVKEAIEHVLKEQAELVERLQRIEESLKIPDTSGSATKEDENPEDRDIAHG